MKEITYFLGKIQRRFLRQISPASPLDVFAGNCQRGLAPAVVPTCQLQFSVITCTAGYTLGATTKERMLG
jgi:hypothetical protein